MIQRNKSGILIIFLFWNVQAQSISDSVNAFTINLLTTVSKEPGSPRNLAISPYTVWSLLSIINEGARGETAKQLENVLRISPNKEQFRLDFQNLTKIISASDSNVSLKTYSGIFSRLDQKINKNFEEIARRNYDAKIESIDFKNTKAASDRINKNVAQATKNRISNFIHPDDLSFAEVFVVSALYFKGAWMMPFNRSQTRRDTFYDEKMMKLGEVDMMYERNSFPYSRLEWIKGYSVELPYGSGDKMSMIVILPYKDQTLQGMLQQMTQHPFTRIIDQLETAKITFEGEDVQVYLPRFQAKADLTLNGVLQKMGITDVFDENKADLLNMFPHYLYITRLIQRAEVEVNEEGTVASAASGATLINKIPPPKFVANKPFLYFIVNKPTKSIVFAGKITIPPGLKK